MGNNYIINHRAYDEAIVKGDKFRFTILTSRLIRIEYSENGVLKTELLKQW